MVYFDQLLAGMIMIAILAVIVSKNSQSSNAISALGTGLTSLISTALAPAQSSQTQTGSAYGNALLQSGQNLVTAGQGLGSSLLSQGN